MSANIDAATMLRNLPSDIALLKDIELCIPRDTDLYRPAVELLMFERDRRLKLLERIGKELTVIVPPGMEAQ